MAPPRRRKKRAIRATAFIFGGMLLLALLAVVTVVLLIDPNDYKLRIAGAVKRQTGLDLAINGRMTILPSLSPTVVANGLTLSKEIIGSYGEIASASRIEASIAPLPLLTGRLVISRLVLVQPRVMLRAGPSGMPDTPPRPATPPAPSEALTGAVTPAPSRSMRVAIRSVEIRDGEIHWREGVAAPALVASVSRLDVLAPAADAPMTAHAEFTIHGVTAVADLRTGPLARLLDAAATGDWPVRVDARATGAALTIDGALRQPSRGRGYDLTLDGTAADLARLGATIGRALPPLHDVAISGHVSDRATGAPVWSALSLHAGRSDLDSPAGDVELESTQLSAASFVDPIKFALKGRYRGADFSAGGTFADPRTLARLRGSDGPAPIDLTLAYAGIAATANGTIASLARLSGVDVALDLRVPDLASLSAPARVPVPPVKDLRVTARLTEADGGLRDGFALRDLTLTTPHGAIGGDASMAYRPRPSIKITLASEQFDLDGMLDDAGPVPVNAPREPTPPQPPGASPPASPAPAAVPASAGARDKQLIPDRPLPLSALRAGDADIDLKLKSITVGGAPYHDVAAHLVLRDGRLALDPLVAETPGGHVEGSLTADAGPPAMPVAIGLHARGLALKPLLAGFTEPDAVSGTALIDVDLRAAGATPHELAASADGRVGISVSDGEIDNRLLTGLASALLRGPRLVETLGGGTIGGNGSGRTRLRCLAARFDVTHGTATATTLLLDTSRLLLQGGGTIAMGDEALALRLRPMLRLGGTGNGAGVVVPLRVGGVLGAPKISVDTLAAVESAQGAHAGAGPAAAERGGDPCAAALAAVAAPAPVLSGAAISGAAPASPPPAPAPATPAPQKAPNSAQILRSLLR